MSEQSGTKINKQLGCQASRFGSKILNTNSDQNSIIDAGRSEDQAQTMLRANPRDIGQQPISRTVHSQTSRLFTNDLYATLERRIYSVLVHAVSYPIWVREFHTNQMAMYQYASNIF